MGLRIRRSRWILGLAALLLALPPAAGNLRAADLAVTATIPSWGFCGFRSNAYTLDFGTLDPTSAVDVTSQSDVEFRCFGWPTVTYYIGRNAGLHGSGPNNLRLKHLTDNLYLPYALTLSPNSGTLPTPFFSSGWQTLQVSGTIRANDYRTAAAGQYTDSVVLTIVP